MMTRAQSFHGYVGRLSQIFKFPIENIANMDESPLSFTGSSKSLRSLCVKGFENVVGTVPLGFI